MSHRALVAIGGNALVTGNAHASIADQFRAARAVARALVKMAAAGWDLVIVHGNGPQVGFILRRVDLALTLAPEIPRIGLDLCVADSQGGIGHIITLALRNELRRASATREVATIVTHTVVDRSDPAFRKPTKPIGAFYSKEQAAQLAASEGWSMVEDAGRGYRRVVPSPLPRRVLEAPAVEALLDRGFLVVAAGGGGIPVVEERGGYRGVEAVIDKDRVSALLAASLGADRLVLTTGVPRVALNFGRPSQRFVDRMSLEEAAGHLADGQFPPGSMGPKVESALAFLAAGGHEVVITSPTDLARALAGQTGTRISRGAVPASAPN